MIGQSDHSRLSGVFAAHWGNDSFKRPEPFESVVRAAMLHDADGIVMRPARDLTMPAGPRPAFMQVALDAEQLGAFQWGRRLG